MAMTKTGEPLNLSAPTSTDTPGWVADFAGNARATNNFAKATNEKIGDVETLQTEYKENLVGAINEVKNLDSEKAPVNHASTEDSFGLGSTTAYGHVKVVNDLNKTAYSNGEALAAYQGKVLKGEIEDADDRVTKIYTDKLVALDEIDLVTEQGFFVDALAVRELNSNLHMLNYSAKQAILTATGASFTAPSDGIIRFLDRAYVAGAFCEYVINGTGTAIANHIPVADYYTSGEFVVCKGDTVTCRYLSIRSVSVYFIPYT